MKMSKVEEWLLVGMLIALVAALPTAGYQACVYAYSTTETTTSK